MTTDRPMNPDDLAALRRRLAGSTSPVPVGLVLNLLADRDWQAKQAEATVVLIDEPNYLLHEAHMPTVPVPGDHVTWQRDGEDAKIGVVKWRRVCSLRGAVIIGVAGVGWWRAGVAVPLREREAGDDE